MEDKEFIFKLFDECVDNIMAMPEFAVEYLVHCYRKAVIKHKWTREYMLNCYKEWLNTKFKNRK